MDDVPASLELDSIVVAARGQVSTNLGGEMVILNISRGVYHSLEEVGAFVWALLEQPRRIAELRDRIVDHYEVDTATCQRDLFGLLKELDANDLIRMVAGTDV